MKSSGHGDRTMHRRSELGFGTAPRRVALRMLTVGTFASVATGHPLAHPQPRGRLTDNDKSHPSKHATPQVNG